MSVTQRGGAYNSPGARARSFSYDSLSRLLSATNPETGAVGYTYDANSNVVTKTDARGLMSTYGYDVLNRLTSKTYSSNDASKTPISCFQYDISSIPGAGGNMIGRLTNQWTIASGSSCTNSPSGSFYALRSILSYDAAGRITNEQQCTPNNCTSGSGPTVSYGYDLAGNNTSLTNSVGAVNGLRQTMPLVLTTGFDGATHTSSLTSNWTSFSPNLFTIAPTNGYAAFGGPANWSLGPSLSVAQSYMNRLWVNNITATGQVR
jgi:YD repeat-containing protein